MLSELDPKAEFFSDHRQLDKIYGYFSAYGQNCIWFLIFSAVINCHWQLLFHSTETFHFWLKIEQCTTSNKILGFVCVRFDWYRVQSIIVLIRLAVKHLICTELAWNCPNFRTANQVHSYCGFSAKPKKYGSLGKKKSALRLTSAGCGVLRTEEEVFNMYQSAKSNLLFVSVN